MAEQCKRCVRRVASAVAFISVFYWAACAPGPEETLHRPPGVPPGPPRILGVEPIEDELPIRVGNTMRYPGEGETFDPLRVLVSRGRYWAEDGHMEIVARLEKAEGALDVRIADTQGVELAFFTIDPVPSRQFIFYPQLPNELLDGGRADIEVQWRVGADARGTHRQSFRVERASRPDIRAGRIAIRVPNPDGLTLAGLPVTVGVPFPRGALSDAAQVRLLDEQGHEVPVQVMETGRWSKFGSVKWLQCDFVVDLDGGARTFTMKYGPSVGRREFPALAVREGEGFPVIDAGRLRIEDGLWWNPAEGAAAHMLAAAALSGAFVEHENGRVYRMPQQDEFVIEEHGSEKVVIRREGWYRTDDGAHQFCRYITRYVVHRDSPVMRIFHTWIFTGDGNRDRIANMGWQFPLADGIEPGGFLTGFDDAGTWASADFLLQWDYAHFDLARDGRVQTREEGRAAGAAAASGPGAALYFGAKDFWQNYPSELEFADGALWFHNWPRHNRPAGHTFQGELVTASGPAALPTAARHRQVEPGRLTNSEWRLNAIQVRFAHEGEMLDFRLPEAFGGEVITEDAMRLHRLTSRHWEPGDVETANAQGISRTEEMWVVVAPAGTDDTAAADVLAGLNNDTLRAVVDPVWVAASGAFFEMHHQDWDRFPEEEHAYQLTAHLMGALVERMGVYGMWIYGDLPGWSMELETLEPGLYRAYRKAHQRWPYSWKPYVRSGDFRLLRYADAATRQMIDANYSHYATEAVDRLVGPERHRRAGRWDRSALPWASRIGTVSRNYATDTDFLWHAWLVTGYRRALDNALDYAEQMKIEEPLLDRRGVILGPGRDSWCNLKTYTDLYEATFDPWFLVGAHKIAGIHLASRRARGSYGGRLWRTGDREFARFSGDEEFIELYLDYARREASERFLTTENVRFPALPPKAFGLKLTGEEYFRRRAMHGIMYGTAGIRTGGEVDYVIGYPFAGNFSLFYPTYLKWFPAGLWAIAQGENRPEPISSLHLLQRDRSSPDGRPWNAVVVRKDGDSPLVLHLGPNRRREGGSARYRVTGSDGEEVLAGTWNIRDYEELVIPAEVAPGEYTLTVEFLSGRPRAASFRAPVTETDHPEVIRMEEGERFGRMFMDGIVWFMVPENVDRFWIELPRPDELISMPPYTAAGRPWMSVWDPDGQRVFSDAEVADWPRSRMRFEIEAPRRHRGRLWRLAMPPPGALMDPAIPPVYSVGPSRWFMPETR